MCSIAEKSTKSKLKKIKINNDEVNRKLKLIENKENSTLKLNKKENENGKGIF